jgi:taurine dioxygenase
MKNSYKHISVAPIAPAIGAEVSGVDLSQTLDDEVFAEIRTAFLSHIVLFFRDQILTPDQQVAFAARFGPIGRYPFAEPVDGNPDVIAIIKEEHQTTNFGGIWHTDTTYLAEPSMGSMLYARQVPPVGGDTMWSNMYAAYDALSDGMNEMLSGLRGINSASKNKDALRMNHLEDGAMKGKDAEQMDVKMATHPIVRTHPETGRKSLYISDAHTICFEGMTEGESAPILEFLFAHAIKEEFTCRFRWTANTLAVWDNRCALHYPLNDYHGHRREMHRITLQGDVPV